MANTFKSNVAANIVTSGNTVYTCPSATQTTLIGMTLANKSAGTITANVFLTRSAVDYSIISNAPILSGSTLVPIGGDQKVVLQAADVLKVTTSATRIQGGLVGTGGSGNTAVQLGTAIVESSNTVYSNYTLTAGNNGYSVGPITVLTGKSITVPTGQKWVVL